MADIRIKDLTTTASTTAADDFFAADGTTNGTRKLSAFSPTFGGNATVTGTLTVNGGTTLNATLVVSSNVGTIGKSGTGTGGNWRFVSDDGTTRWLSGILGGAGETSFSIYDIANSRSLLTATAAGVVQINQTTASTTTSSGALVVSGGVGVAGAIYAGGDVFVVKADPSFTLTRTANTNSALFQLTTGATYDFAFGLRNTTDSDFHLYNYGTSSDALTIARASSNATFAGTVIANASSNAFRITTAQTPASAGATGTAGTICWDTSYIYVCTATNTWKRVAISTW